MRASPPGCLSLLVLGFFLLLPFFLANALLTALLLNVGLCFVFAKPVPEIGITMPPLVPAGAGAL